MIILSARLELRPFTEDDLPDLAPLLADPDFMAWSVDGPMNRWQARRRLRALVESYRTHGFSKWAIRLKGKQRLIGYCGLEIEVIDGRSVPELGYRLHPDDRGKGLATEAAQATLADAFKRLALSSVYAFVEPGNGPSQRILARLGMRLERRIMLKGRDYRLYRRRRSDWVEAALMPVRRTRSGLGAPSGGIDGDA